MLHSTQNSQYRKVRHTRRTPHVPPTVLSIPMRRGSRRRKEFWRQVHVGTLRFNPRTFDPEGEGVYPYCDSPCPYCNYPYPYCDYRSLIAIIRTLIANPRSLIAIISPHLLRPSRARASGAYVGWKGVRLHRVHAHAVADPPAQVRSYDYDARNMGRLLLSGTATV